jgi:protein-tyrosine phosphatase
MFVWDPPCLILADSSAGKLWLGNAHSALSPESPKHLQDLEIRAILNCSALLPMPFPDEFEYCHIPLRDTCEQKLLTKYLELGVRFLDMKLNQGYGVLVHCAQGKSRSTTVIIAFLMLKRNYSLKDALLLIRSKRSIAAPNLNFFLQLQQLELAICRAKQLGQVVSISLAEYMMMIGAAPSEPED